MGGTAQNVTLDANIKAKFDGIIKFEEMRTVSSTDAEGNPVEIVMGRSGEVQILNAANPQQVFIANNVPYGSYLRVKDGQAITKGDEICAWDPYNAVILSEVEGTIQFDAIEENVTYKEEADEQTGLREKVIIESKDKTKNPSIMVNVKGADEPIIYNVPVAARLAIENKAKIKPGQILAKIPRAAGKTRDITGGLPRVTELFEARNPSNPAVVSEIDGVITLGGIKRGNREIYVRAKDGAERKYLVPLSKHILVQNNDFVRAGIPLSDGAITPSDILAIKGPTAVQEYLVNEIQDVYRLQGVKINDKHIESIVRQMMQKVIIIESGDTMFLNGQSVNRFVFREDNDNIMDKKVVIEAGDSEKMKVGMIVSTRALRDENSSLKRRDMKIVQVRDVQAAVAHPHLQGITQASLGTDSFMSAASFQETTKVLSEASIRAKQDCLEGLKENVIVGHLIPAGTGVRKYLDYQITSKEELQQIETSKDARAAEKSSNSYRKARWTV